MLESTSGTCAFEVPRTGNRHQPFFGGCPRGVRNWKQACPFFSELPRVEFRVEFGTGNRHVPFFRSCPAWSSVWSSAQSWGDNRIEGGNPGVTTGLKEAILEFFSWESLGAGSAGLRCRAGAAGRQECGALGVGRASTWASPYSLGKPVLGEPSNEVGASHQTRLGEPSNEVGRASTKGAVGKPLNFDSLHACFKAAPAWCGAYSACSAHLLSACSAHLLSACSARLVKCRHCARSALCLLGTFS